MIRIDNSQRLIFVNIKNSYKAMIDKDKSNPYYRENLKECTRKYWNIADNKANCATHILGCYIGIVKVVIRIASVSTSKDEYPGRKVFDGEELNDSPYIDMDIRTIFESIANFRVKYYNL